MADFHSLRGEFVTNLSKAGAHLPMAREMARHSTPDLTSNAYTHVTLKEQRDVLEKLPDLSHPFRQEQHSTGTYGRSDMPADESRILPSGLPQKGTEAYNSVQRNAVNDAYPSHERRRENFGENSENSDKESGWGGIRTPGTVSRTAVFKTAAFDHSATHPALLFHFQRSEFY